MPKKSADTTGELTLKMKEIGSVYYEKSITKNLGNYESTKITVGVTLSLSPSEADLVQVKKVVELADEITTEELSAKIEELVKDLRERED